ncbi:MAG TPA: hypothetical protein VF590_25965 [Isosphaeraceae bacterium]
MSAAVATVLVAGLGLAVFGSARALPALWRGRVLLADPDVVSVGELRVGRRDQVSFLLTNLGARPVRVNGLRASCTCVSADALPLEIPARGRRPLRLWVHPLEEQAGTPYSQSVDLYLSVPGPRVSLTVRGTVAKQTTTPCRLDAVSRRQYVIVTLTEETSDEIRLPDRIEDHGRSRGCPAGRGLGGGPEHARGPGRLPARGRRLQRDADQRLHEQFVRDLHRGQSGQLL